MATDNQRTCVICRQLLPPSSKLTLSRIAKEEAERNGWAGREDSDGAVIVDMCLQCQIDRSKRAKGQ